MPFTSWACHPPPTPRSLGRQGPTPSSLSWPKSRQRVNKVRLRSGPSLAKLVGWHSIFYSSPTFVLIWKGQPSSENCQAVLIYDLKIISRMQLSLPFPLFPLWYNLHPLSHGYHSCLLLGLLLWSPSPQSALHMQTEGAWEPRIRSGPCRLRALPSCPSLLVKAKSPHCCLSP